MYVEWERKGRLAGFGMIAVSAAGAVVDFVHEIVVVENGAVVAVVARVKEVASRDEIVETKAMRNVALPLVMQDDEMQNVNVEVLVVTVRHCDIRRICYS